MPTNYESDLEQQVARLLRESKTQFVTQPSLGGLRPDFLLTMANGKRVVVEVKGWSGNPSHIARAVRQVRLYQRATDADEALIVAPMFAGGRPAKGVMSVHEFEQWLRRHSNSQRSNAVARTVVKKSAKRPVRQKVVRSNRPFVFAAMPFDTEFDDVFWVAMVHAAKAANAVCVRTDEEEYSDDIVRRIIGDIRKCIAIIADVSGSRANVLYELGFAHELAKPSVQLSRTSTNELPFDIRNRNTLMYSAGQVNKLKPLLAKRLKAVLAIASS